MEKVRNLCLSTQIRTEMIFTTWLKKMTKNNKSSWIFSFRPGFPRDFLLSLVFLSKNLFKSHEKSNNKQQSWIIMLLWYDFYNFLLKEKLSQLRSMCQSVTECTGQIDFLLIKVLISTHNFLTIFSQCESQCEKNSAHIVTHNIRWHQNSSHNQFTFW